jgi:GNAT superfamily N-acetyltransferase
MVGLEVHKIDESQIPKIIELAKEIWLPTFQPFFTALELQSLFEGMYAPDKLKFWFAQPGNQMFTIGPKDMPEGYFAFAEKEDKFWLDKIYVHPKIQGTGIGYHTWLWVKDKADKKGYKNVWLRVNRRNQQAINFYLKVGFKIESSVDFEGPNGFVYDDYLMNCPVL